MTAMGIGIRRISSTATHHRPTQSLRLSPLVMLLPSVILLMLLLLSACKPAEKPNEILVFTDEGISTEQVLTTNPSGLDQQTVTTAITTTTTATTSPTTVANHSNPQPLSLFEETIPRPKWFDKKAVIAVNTSQEVSALWQSKKRCCVDKKTLRENNREFYRACYQAIVNHVNNEELVVKCLWLMDTGLSGAERTQFNRFLLDNYPDHQNNITRCANCSTGDTVARVTRELAARMNREAQLDEAILLIENLLERRDDISLWVQLEIHETLGRFYLKQAKQQQRETTNTQQQRFLDMDQTIIKLAANEKLAAWREKNYRKVRDRVLSH